MNRLVRMPQMPCGANITKAMKIEPKISGHRSVTCESWCSRKTKNTPPMIGPIRVPAPPTTTMMSTRPEMSQKNSSGEAKPAKPAYSAPASPPKP